jgi:hypothetical protein
MSTLDLIRDTHNGKLTRLDAYSKSIEATNGLPKRIEMLVSEIDEYIKEVVEPLKENLYLAYDYTFHLHFDLEPKTHYKLLALDYESLEQIKEEVYLYCIENNIDMPWLIPDKIEMESLFYAHHTERLEQLKNDLRGYIDNPTESNPKESTTAKGVWGLVARYNFLDELGVLKPLEQSGITKKDLQIAVSQILGCNVYTARDLINGDYNAKETKDEQLERHQLINLIKYKQTE